MKTLYRSLLLTLGAPAFSGTLIAQVPSTNDTSTTDSLFNTGMGTGALGTTGTNSGYNNTAAGANALASNTGNYNVAFGSYVLFTNTTGGDNTASGYSALYENTAGVQNTASGYRTLYYNKAGKGNTAFGFQALLHNTGGQYNVAVGYEAGQNLTTGKYNIDIGSEGEASDGTAADSGVIRIGTSGQQLQTFIAGINNSMVTGAGVVVDPSTGQLGVVSSSERYKTAITPIGEASEKLQQLRPVRFHLKADPSGAVQYGLIAEEVDKVYPELVIHDATGKIVGVRYDELAPMLLSEAQQQQNKDATQDARIRDLEHQVAEMRSALHSLSAKRGQ